MLFNHYKCRCNTLYRKITPVFSQKYFWTTDLSIHIQRPSFWNCFIRGSRLSLYSGMLRYSSLITTTTTPPVKTTEMKKNSKDKIYEKNPKNLA